MTATVTAAVFPAAATVKQACDEDYSHNHKGKEDDGNSIHSENQYVVKGTWLYGEKGMIARRKGLFYLIKGA